MGVDTHTLCYEMKQYQQENGGIGRSKKVGLITIINLDCDKKHSEWVTVPFCVQLLTVGRTLSSSLKDNMPVTCVVCSIEFNNMFLKPGYYGALSWVTKVALLNI